ncbi:hypothetical protein HDU98_007392 [Podochytrium sp. JEL0797]|nr:hypothetical protein HDU98_007392 [Podochytrium sp. JEL0797]
MLNSDALVNPGPGMAPIMILTSTIINQCEGVVHDRHRIKRLGLRIQTLVLVLNTLAHCGAFGSERLSSPLRKETPLPYETPPTPRSAKRASLLTRAVSRLSLALSPQSPPSPSPVLAAPPLGTVALKNTQPPRELFTPAALVALLERVKGFIKNNSSDDLLRIMGTRQRFEDRLRLYQGLVRTWIEECGDGIQNPEMFELDDMNDIVADIESLKAILSTHISKLSYPTADSHSFGDGGESTDDDADFELLPELHIDPGMYSAAREFAERRFCELVSIAQESAQLAAVFFSTEQSEVSHYSIDISLEIKWLGLVVKSLSGYEPLEKGSISPYDLDEEGDGAPLGPVGIAESVRGSLFLRGNSGLDCRDVVIKRFRTPKKNDVRRLFIEHTASWLSTSSDKRILPILGTCYQTLPQLIITPYMRNGNISTYSKLHPGHSLRLLYETASSMAILHGMGVLHGALRSSNVLVDDLGKAVVTDFGMGEYRREVALDGIGRNGWRRWAAPELLRGGAIRPQSDVYSFAMTAYEILSGQVPFSNTLHDPDDPDGFDPDTEETEITRLVLYDAMRPHRPTHCPDQFWALLESCWAQDFMERPSFESVQEKVQGLVKMQSAWRRMSQIKSRAEAFLVEVPLDDLLSSVLAVGGGKASPLRVEIPGVEEEEVRSLGVLSEEHKISVNLSFTLDDNIYLSTIPTVPLGIDLPPTVGESDTDTEFDEDELTMDSVRWSSEYDESVYAFWDVLVAGGLEEAGNTPVRVPWGRFVDALKGLYPTLVTSLPSLKAAFGEKGEATFARFRDHVRAQVPESKRGEEAGDGFARVESVFGKFCVARDAERGVPQSCGPVDWERVGEVVASLGGGGGGGGVHAVVGLPNGLGLEVVNVLVDERVLVEEGGFKEVVNGVVDQKGFLALHVAARQVHNAGVVKVLMENGADAALRSLKGGWTPAHVAAWSGAARTVGVLLEQGGVVGMRDEEGWTCLMHAARYGHLEAVKVIVGVVERECVGEVEGMKREASELAGRFGWSEVVEFLEPMK